ECSATGAGCRAHRVARGYDRVGPTRALRLRKCQRNALLGRCVAADRVGEITFLERGAGGIDLTSDRRDAFRLSGGTNRSGAARASIAWITGLGGWLTDATRSIGRARTELGRALRVIGTGAA